MLDPADATLYSNQSFCHMKIGGARDALVDANAYISLQPERPKGYYSKGVGLMSLKVLLWFFCFMVICCTSSAGVTHCDSAELAQSMGFCTTNTPIGPCWLTVLNIVERNAVNLCICGVINHGVEVDRIIRYYYICDGKYQALEALINICKGPTPPPPPINNNANDTSPPLSQIIRNSSCQKDCDEPKSDWSGTTILLIVLLSFVLLGLVTWLLYLLTKKSRGVETPFLPTVDGSHSPDTSVPDTSVVPVHSTSEKGRYKSIFLGAFGWLMCIYLLVKQKFRNEYSQDTGVLSTSSVQMTNTRLYIEVSPASPKTSPMRS